MVKNMIYIFQYNAVNVIVEVTFLSPMYEGVLFFKLIANILEILIPPH